MIKIGDIIEYGEICRITGSGYSLWYEPITDEIDGIVLRDANDYIVCVFESKTEY